MKDFGRRKFIFVLMVIFSLGTMVSSLIAENSIQMEISPREAYVGDPIQVRLFIPDLDENQVTWPPPSGNLGDLTILNVDTAKTDEIVKQGGVSLTWTVAAYDTGSFSTGDLEVVTAVGMVKALGGNITINTVLTDSTATQLKPLKAQVDLPYTFKDLVLIFGPYLLGLIVLIIIFWFVRKWLRNRKGILDGIDTSEPPIPPYDEAIIALNKLKKDNPLKQGDFKAYVSALSEISKRLLTRVHEAPVLEMTTWEFKRWLNDNRIKVDKHELLGIMEDGDKVKFAKGSISGQRCEEMLIGIEELVEAYKPAPVTEEESKGNNNSKSENRNKDKAVSNNKVSESGGGAS